jgi:hypothetical protein
LKKSALFSAENKKQEGVFMRFKRLESSNMIYRLAGRVFTTVGEAQEFYGLGVVF